jgi:hypothetical protein
MKKSMLANPTRRASFGRQLHNRLQALVTRAGRTGAGKVLPAVDPLIQKVDCFEFSRRPSYHQRHRRRLPFQRHPVVTSQGDL